MAKSVNVTPNPLLVNATSTVPGSALSFGGAFSVWSIWVTTSTDFTNNNGAQIHIESAESTQLLGPEYVLLGVQPINQPGQYVYYKTGSDMIRVVRARLSAPLTAGSVSANLYVD